MRTLFIGCVAIMAMVTSAPGEELLAYYTVARAEVAPVIDGKLDEPCWAGADTSDVYYKYLAQTPIAGELKTAFQMVYDEKGVYLAIINYDEHPGKVRANAITRDDSKLWFDDCAEIYFDPYASSIGFVKFAVNAIGTLWDSKRIDSAIELASWSGYNWTAATSRRDDAWVIEAFFPWSDLGREAREGDVWRFTHVRYAWPEGKFKGVSSSLGGGYYGVDRFGFIRFSGNANPDRNEIIQVLSEGAAPPWMVLLDGRIVRCDLNGDISSVNPDEFAKTAKGVFEKAEARLQALGAGAPLVDLSDERAGPKKEAIEAYLSTKEKLSAMDVRTPLEALELGKALRSLAGDADSIYWQVKTRNYIAKVAEAQTAGAE